VDVIDRKCYVIIEIGIENRNRDKGNRNRDRGLINVLLRVTRGEISVVVGFLLREGFWNASAFGSVSGKGLPR